MVYKKTRKVLIVLVLYTRVVRAIYRMLEASPLYGTKNSDRNWKEKDSCLIHMAHVLPTVRGEDPQHTVLFHVDALESSHKDSRFNNKFERWLLRN